MLVEIGLLQRMSVFLGHPTYAISVVLFALILLTGLGSLLADRWPLRRSRDVALWATATAAYATTMTLTLPLVLPAFEAEGLLVRAGLVVALIAPGALLMGYGFPTGMALARQIDDGPTPWFWGINGVAGVAASGIAVAVGISFGLSVTLILGALCYLLLIPAALLMRDARRRAGAGIASLAPAAT